MVGLRKIKKLLSMKPLNLIKNFVNAKKNFKEFKKRKTINYF